MSSRLWTMIAALLGATGVGMAAYASHGLGFIADPAQREATRSTLQLAVQMQLFHALALLATGLWARLQPSRWLVAAGSLFLLGVLLFCGLIYLRIFTGTEALRPLVPWGGTSLMLAWLSLGLAGWKSRNTP